MPLFKRLLSKRSCSTVTENPPWVPQMKNSDLEKQLAYMLAEKKRLTDICNDLKEKIAMTEKKRKTIQNLHDTLKESYFKLNSKLTELKEEKERNEQSYENEYKHSIVCLKLQIRKYTKQLEKEKQNCELTSSRIDFIQSSWEKRKMEKMNQISEIRYNTKMLRSKINEVSSRVNSIKHHLSNNHEIDDFHLNLAFSRIERPKPHKTPIEIEKLELMRTCQNLQKRRDMLLARLNKK